MNEVMMTAEELQKLLAARGLGRVADALMALAAPTVRIFVAPDDEAALAPGASKLGGHPDLPPGVTWPTWHEPLAFLGQLNLAEVTPHDREGALPDRGLLSFFYETDMEPLYAARLALGVNASPAAYAGFDESLGWRVLYHTGDPAAFVRHEFPPALNHDVRFPACAARFAAEVTLPDVDSAAIAALGLSPAERAALIDIDAEVNHGVWEDGGHHLLGYPYSLGESGLVACALATPQAASWAAATPERRQTIALAVEQQWRLLLQITSSDDLAMDWAGGGVLHVCVERAALRVRDFSRVSINLQFL
jgi:uncharacterized protein YwqG